MTLHYWSRTLCRWRTWHGTFAAWKALPHAVVGAGCTVALSAVVIHHLDGPKPAPVPPVSVPPAVYLAGLPQGPALSAPPVTTWSAPFTDYPGTYVPRDVKCDHDKDDPASCKRRTVPEPGPLWLMMAGVALLGLWSKGVPSLDQTKEHGLGVRVLDTAAAT